MNKITEKAWEVFRSVFKDGEQVIVEDCRGRFYWGKLKCFNDYILLTQSGGRSIEFDWDNIEFMSHDGFPVKKLMGMTPEEAEKKAKQTSEKIIKEFFDDLLEEVYFGGGCPFIAGPCEYKATYNKGNTGKEFEYSDAVEVLEFQSKDGAIMHSYDTNHLFLIK